MTVPQRVELLVLAGRAVGRVAQQIQHPDVSAALARLALSQAALARRRAAVTDADPPELQRALADLLILEATLLGGTGSRRWQ